MTSVAAESATVADLQMQEPGVLRSFWASVSAVIVKELRWRMRGRRAFVIVTIYVALLALLVFLLQRTVEDAMSFSSTAIGPRLVSFQVPHRRRSASRSLT